MAIDQLERLESAGWFAAATLGFLFWRNGSLCLLLAEFYRPISILGEQKSKAQALSSKCLQMQMAVFLDTSSCGWQDDKLSRERHLSLGASGSGRQG